MTTELSNCKTLVQSLNTELANYKKKFDNQYIASDTKASDYNIDVNSIVQPGIYRTLVSPSNPNGPGFWCYLVVFCYVVQNQNLTQVAIGYNQPRIAVRYRYQNNWSVWTINK